MMRSLAAASAALALLTSCGGAPQPEPAGPHGRRSDTHEPSEEPPLAGRDPSADELEALREAMRIAERLRALRFERPVPVRVQSRADITAFVRSRIDEQELEDARIFYVALGLLAPEVDVRALVIDVMGEQIAGFYDPRRHTMVVRDDMISDLAVLASRGGSILGSQNAMVLVHEYVHALQDQRLGLREDDERSIDEANAYACLVEGDATLTMLGIGLAGSGRSLSDITRVPGLLRSQLATSAEAGPEGSELASAPPILRAPLMSRYLDGLVYAGALHAERGFASVDAAFRNPPSTTEQVLHPARYVVGELAAPIALPPLPAMDAAGYRALDEETLGEVELSVYFAQGSATDRDRSAAAGWDGDRIRVYHRAGTAPSDGSAPPAGDAPPASSALVWFLAWDDEAEATEAEAAALRVSPRASGSPAGATTVRRVGRALAITAGLPEGALAQANAAFDELAASLR